MAKKNKDYEYPFAKDFDGYLSNNVDDRNKQNIKSRINTIWQGYRPANGGMKLINDDVKFCWY